MAEKLPDPITSELRDAFWAAMGAYKDWHRGMPEPEYVSLDRRPTAVSIICELVSKSEETTPDWLWNVLKAITGRVDDLPNDQSYRSAAQHLSRLIKERKELYDRLDRLEEGRR